MKLIENICPAAMPVIAVADSEKFIVEKQVFNPIFDIIHWQMVINLSGFGK